MKIIKRIGGLLLATLMIFCVSCKDNPDNSDPIDGGDDSGQEDVITDVSIIADGETDYKIVVPVDAGTKINMAARELQYFFQEATGVSLSIIRDTNLSFDENDSYFSIGETTLYEESGVTVDKNVLGTDGLRLVTKGSTVIMIGTSDIGSMYAMYEFLERTFNLEVYAADEFYIDRNITDLKLKDFDVTEVPVFEQRTLGFFPYTQDETYRNRMRQELYNESWIMWSHSHFRILPPETYWEAHKDWYYPKNAANVSEVQQLCLTNEEMRAEFTKNVIQYVKDNPDCTYMMCGHEDTLTFCDCGDCTSQAAIYKNSGVNIHFTNKVAEEVQAYIDANEPGREFSICTFAYLSTEEAPVKETENGYEPIDNSVLPRKNVRIMLAPIYTCSAHSLDSTCNARFKPIFAAWKAIAEDQIFMWIYGKNFSVCFMPFNNWSTFVDYYGVLEDMGTEFIYHQSNTTFNAGGMQEIMCYLEAKYMWDRTLNFDTLVDDFCTNYYKEAGTYYREYFDLVRLNYEKWCANGLHCYNNSQDTSVLDAYNAKYWTESLLSQMDDLFDKMIESIEKYKDTDEELYKTLQTRIEKERLSVTFLYLSFYMDELTYDEAKAKIDSFEDYCTATEISQWRERDGAISDLLSDWRLELSQK